MSTGGGSQVRRMLVVVDNLADRSGIPFFLEIVDVLEQEIVVKRTDLRKIRTTVFIPNIRTPLLSSKYLKRIMVSK